MEADDQKYIKFLADRIAVLEQLVVGLLQRNEVPEELVRQWREHVANWPERPRSLTEDTIRLVETIQSQARHTHEPPKE